MELSKEQIQQLFKFTEKKYVHWYDLQIELVDHLASRIEEEMDAEKSLNFDSALHKVYKEFGISGFSKVVAEKSTQLYRQAQKIWWHELLLLLKWPKIVLFAMILGILWQLSLMFDPYVLLIGFAVIDILVGIVLLIFQKRSFRTKRKLMLLQIGPGSSPSGIFIYESIFLSLIIGNFETPHLAAPLFCIYAIIAIFIRVASFQLFYKVKEKARVLYPEAFA